MPKTRAASSIPTDLLKVIKLIPGYDPIGTAGDCVFDADKARLAIDFFHECLRHVKGEKANQPFILEPWQQAIIANMFGWYRPDGTRRYREVFIFVPRKNGKTAMIGGLLNYVLLCDNEPGAEIYCAAADREQASLAYGQARDMALRDPELRKRITVYATSKTVTYGNSFYRAISADAGTKHGYNSHMVVVDELHAQRDRELVDVLKTSMGSRRQPLLVYITTSDFDRPSICNETLDYAYHVRDGIIEAPHFLPVIYEALKTDDWTDPKVWHKANPNLGVSLSEAYLRQECERAKETPAYENTFKRLHLNIRTEQATRWLQMDVWDSCDTIVPVESLVGQSCYCGLDLASTTDIAAFHQLFQPEDDLVVLVPHFFIPEARAHERERRDGVPYLTWAKQGYVHLTPGNSIDYRFIRAHINKLAERNPIAEIAFDPWNATQIATELAEEDGFNLIQFRQGAKSYNEPCKEFERLLLAGQIVHNNNPVLRWMASNVEVVEDANQNIRPVKPEAGSAKKIDGITSAIMALGRAMFAPEPEAVGGIIVI